MTRLYDEKLAAHRMTTTQFAILRRLFRAGGELRPSRLADRLVTDRTSLRHLLTHVEYARWVVVEQINGDEREAMLDTLSRLVAGSQDRAPA